jgi:hypothetical protein
MLRPRVRGLIRERPTTHRRWYQSKAWKKGHTCHQDTPIPTRRPRGLCIEAESSGTRDVVEETTMGENIIMCSDWLADPGI